MESKVKVLFGSYRKDLLRDLSQRACSYWKRLVIPYMYVKVLAPGHKHPYVGKAYCRYYSNQEMLVGSKSKCTY